MQAGVAAGAEANAPASRVEESVRGKVRLRLAYACTLIMFMSSLDRVNVSFAAHQMNEAVGLSPSLYGFGAGIFFVGFLIAQFPSVYLLKLISAPRWFFTLMLTWGAAATAMAFLQSPEMYYALRVVLGLAEGGLAPGMVLYLSGFTSERDRAGNFAAPMLAIPISIVLGAPISAWLMSMHDNPLGLPGWRWMFLIEGLPTILLAILALFHFPRTPAEAKWLTSEEKAWIAENNSMRVRPSAPRTRGAFTNPWLWVSAAIWFCLLGGAYGIIFWLPQVIRQFADLSEVEVGFVAALPWVGALIGMFWNPRHSDKTGERFWHVALPALVAGAAYAIAVWTPPTVSIVLLFIGGLGLGAAQGAFWAIPTKLFSPAVMATGIVAVNIAGSSSGMITPWLIGVVRERTNDFTIPIYIVGLLLVMAAALTVWAKFAGARSFAAPDAR
ncbi:MAG: MFS transporter [Hyphomonadaceae bacterium]|nr:MFS transporter [Hyphomonadaceae bacterium]